MYHAIKPRKKDIEQLEKRYKKAHELHMQFLSILQKAVQICSPMSDGLNILQSLEEGKSGEDTSIDVFNAIPQTANMQRAKKLHSILCPTNKKWGTAYSKHEGVEVYDEQATDFIFNQITNSNIHEALDPFFLDYNMGCAALFVESKTKHDHPIVFKALSGVTLMPEYSDNPSEKNCWWRRAINWHELNDLNPSIANKYNDKEKRFFVTCGFVRYEENYLYIECLGENFEEILTYEIRPFNQLILVNDTVRPGEVRGRGVILQILSDINRLNEITKSWLKSTDYNAAPAQLASDDLPYTKLEEIKGGIIPNGLSLDGRPAIQPLIWQTDNQNTYAAIKDLENKIQQYFNVMPLGQPDDTPVKTATEVSIRKADSERELISVVAKNASQLTVQLLEVVYNISVATKALKADRNQKMVFKFDSPEIDMQNADDLDAMLKASEIVNQIAGQGAYQTSIDPEKVTSEVNDKLKIPKEIMKSPEQMVAQYQAMQQMMGQQQGQPGAMQGQLPPVQQQAPVAINPTQLGQGMAISGMGE